MPTYEYECTKCGHTFEAFQSMTEKPLSRCPVCKSAVRRIIHGGMGVIFKGSGFYTTDYKKSSALTSPNGGSREKEKAADTSSSAKGSSEKGSSEKSSSEKSSSGKSEKTPAT
jgi:putative FmdB family regulatory protein